MYNIVTTVDNTVLYNKIAERIEVKCSHQRVEKVNMWLDGCVN